MNNNHNASDTADSEPELVEETSTESVEAEPAEISTRALIMGGVGFLALLTALYLLVQAIGIDNLQQTIADAGALGPLIFIAIKAMTFTFAPLSAGPIQFASGILFGNVFLGTLYSVIGELIGGCVSFLIARHFGRPIVVRFVGQGAMKRVDEFYERFLDDWKSLLVARVFLFSVYDFISYAVGFSKIKFWVYVVVSFIGGLLPTFIFVWVGAEASQDSDFLLLIFLGTGIVIFALSIFRRPIGRMWNNLLGKNDNS